MSFIRLSIPSNTRGKVLAPLAIVAFSLAACTTTPLPPVAPTVPSAPQVTPPTPPVATPPVAPPAPTALQMVPSTFAALPGWDKDDLRAAWPAFMSSCGVLVKQITWKESCTIARTVNANDDKAIRTFFEAFLEPKQIIAPDGADNGLITGYYEPLLRGARKKGRPIKRRCTRCPTI